MAEVLIRRAEARDREAMISLMGALHDSEAALESNRAKGEASAESHLIHVLGEMERLGGDCLVTEVAGQVEGFLVYTIEEDPGTFVKPERRRHGLLWDISVGAGMRGRGIGRRLVEAAEAALKAQGVTEMRLYVLAANKRAQALYRELGYGDYELFMAKRF